MVIFFSKSYVEKKALEVNEMQYKKMRVNVYSKIQRYVTFYVFLQSTRAITRFSIEKYQVIFMLNKRRSD